MLSFGRCPNFFSNSLQCNFEFFTTLWLPYNLIEKISRKTTERKFLKTFGLYPSPYFGFVVCVQVCFVVMLKSTSLW